MNTVAIIIPLILCLIPLVTVSGENEVCRCSNSKEINPVCASDNITYINPGQMKCVNQCEGKNLQIIDQKPCPCNCPNTKEIDYVCADDDNTYVNRGAVRCHNKCNYNKIKIVNSNKCRQEDNGLPY